MKSVRHSIISEIIESRDIETQEELAQSLRERGINVTQATVSRDIKEMRLLKILSDRGKYKYATVDKAEKSITDRLIRIFSESVLSVNGSVNLIVIKTLSGSANAACEAIDALRWPEVLGTLAGDNTILIVLTSEDCREAVIDRFMGIMR